MPNFDIVKKSVVLDSYRTETIISKYDIQTKNIIESVIYNIND